MPRKCQRCNFDWLSKVYILIIFTDYIQILVDVLLLHKTQQTWNKMNILSIVQKLIFKQYYNLKILKKLEPRIILKLLLISVILGPNTLIKYML